MSRIKLEKEIVLLREGGRRLARILEEVIALVKPGIATSALDNFAYERILAGGDVPAFLNYTPLGAARPFPATMCISINDEIVHGIPNEKEKKLTAGDIVGLDIGLVHGGMVVDMAKTVPVGDIDAAAQKLIQTTQEALAHGIAAVRPGVHIGDIGAAIKKFADPFGYGIVRELGGHGVGHAVHEEPYIPNVGKKGAGEPIVSGMVLAIEPMLNEGSRHIMLDPDSYTYRTTDGTRSAHFEHTIVVTATGSEILTLP